MRLLILCVCSLLFHYNPLAAQKNNDKRNYYNVYVNYPDYTVRAAIRKKPATFKPGTELTYYWYAANQVNATQGGYDGKLLHGSYTAFYLNNNLKEKGRFVNGLKEGQWQSWHADGKLNEIIHYKKGLRNGKYESYDTKGRPVVKAAFKAGKLHGKSETYLNGELSATRYYKNGEEFVPKVRGGPGKSREASRDNIQTPEKKETQKNEHSKEKKTSRDNEPTTQKKESEGNEKPKKKLFSRKDDSPDKKSKKTKSKKKAADEPAAVSEKKS